MDSIFVLSDTIIPGIVLHLKLKDYLSFLMTCQRYKNLLSLHKFYVNVELNKNRFVTDGVQTPSGLLIGKCYEHVYTLDWINKSYKETEFIGGKLVGEIASFLYNGTEKYLFSREKINNSSEYYRKNGTLMTKVIVLNDGELEITEYKENGKIEKKHWSGLKKSIRYIGNYKIISENDVNISERYTEEEINSGLYDINQ